MSGHSKWATIRHKKAALDSKRGKLWTRIIKEITVAARLGGGDPASNPRLRTAVAAAKSANCPGDNITRAIQKGTGDLAGVQYEECAYEGYGPGGFAVMVECVTDNRTRTVGEVRNIFTKNGGNMGDTGCVGFLFTRQGVIVIEGEKVNEDELFMAATEAGADDVKAEAPIFTVITQPDLLDEVRSTLEKAGFPIVSAERVMTPTSTTAITDRDKAKAVFKFMERMEDLDDVQNVYANFDIPEELMAELEG